MDLSRLRSQLSPAFASLFILLVLVILSMQNRPSVGLRMPLLKLHHNRDLLSCDGNFVFIRLLDEGKTKLNQREIRDVDLIPQISTIMEKRAARVVYLVPSPEIPFSRFAETLGALKTIPDLHVAVLSGKLRDDFMPKSSEIMHTPCDLVWPLEELYPNSHTPSR